MPEKARMMKEIVSESLETAVIGCMDAGQYAVKYTYDKEKAVKKFKVNGVNSLDDLYKIDVVELDRLARDVADVELEQKYVIQGNEYHVNTVNLAAPFKQIRERLLAIV